MARDIEIKITRHEAAVIVTALGTLKNRTAQKARWQTVKRMRTLRQRLATAITIGDQTERQEVEKAMEHSRQMHDKFSVRAAGIGGLQENIRKSAGIGHDEKIDYSGLTTGEWTMKTVNLHEEAFVIHWVRLAAEALSDGTRKSPYKAQWRDDYYL